VAVTLMAGAGAAAAIEPGGANPGRTAGTSLAPGAPNFLFVLVDDQATNSFRARFMPETFRWIVTPGTRFTNALAAPPLCCPDRAGLITGQYPHNHNVWSNHPGYATLADSSNTLPAWLRNAGYRTGYFGKFLNHYKAVRGFQPAPGFDRWFAFTEEESTYYRYWMSDDGVLTHYGLDRSDYSTDVLTRQARTFIRESDASPRPFFAWVAYSAPHVNPLSSGPCAGLNPMPPDEATYRRFAGTTLPQPPSFNERNVSDKPWRVAHLPPLDAATVAKMTLRWRCTLATMSEVDRGVGQLMSQLRDEGVLSHTIVIYLSDNGSFFGEHRIPDGKGLEYEPALRVPFAVYVPPAFRSGVPAAKSGAVVTNQDIAPTILHYVNRFARPAPPCNPPADCRRMDGRTLGPLLGGGGRWRSGRGVLAEIDARRTPTPARAGPARAGERPPDPECNCAYEAIRTHRYLYVDLAAGPHELYDLKRDPHQLVNRARSHRYVRVRRRLSVRLARLERCSGQRHREAPTPAPFCE
jgi:N-acetylglucosamine-6-sulfatase